MAAHVAWNTVEAFHLALYGRAFNPCSKKASFVAWDTSGQRSFSPGSRGISPCKSARSSFRCHISVRSGICEASNGLSSDYLLGSYRLQSAYAIQSYELTSLRPPLNSPSLCKCHKAFNEGVGSTRQAYIQAGRCVSQAGGSVLAFCQEA